MSPATTPDDMDDLKRRLTRTLALTLAAFLLAAIAMVGYFGAHIALFGPVFLAAIALGVGAQIRFILAFARGGGFRKDR